LRIADLGLRIDESYSLFFNVASRDLFFIRLAAFQASGWADS